ncbi:MAG: DUF86 domain-containing protein [bacterium]
MIDRERIAQYLDGFDRILEDWKILKSEVSCKDIAEKRDICHRVCYVMLVAIQTAIDMANLIIANEKLRRPSSYRESFEILSAEKIISKENADVLKQLAGFRNYLVHQYVKLNYKRVCDNLKKGFNSLNYFRRAVGELTRKSAG